MLGEVFAEGAADVGFWATCTKRSMISCAISVRAPEGQAFSWQVQWDDELTFQVVRIDVELVLPFSAPR